MKARGKILLAAILLSGTLIFPNQVSAQTLHEVLNPSISSTVGVSSISQPKSENEWKDILSLRAQVVSIYQDSPSELGEFLSDVDNQKLKENAEQASSITSPSDLRKLVESSIEIQTACRRLKEGTEAARQRAAEEAARAAEQARKEEMGRNIQAASYRVGSPGANLCAAWVSYVMQAAGFGYPSGNANDMYYRWCVSENQADIRAGMVIAVSTHSHTSAGRIWGHVGLIIQHEDGTYWVRENIGYINERPLQEWIDYYSTTVPAKWGWSV